MLSTRVIMGSSLKGAAFSPADIPNLKMWLDATQITANDGDKVSVWQDVSGNGFNAIVNAPLTAPTYKTNGLNGNPVVNFVASLGQALRAHPTVDIPYTLFVVARLTGGANERVFASMNSNYLVGWWNGREDVMYAGNGFVADLAPASTTWKQYTAKGTGALTSFYKNGSLLAENSAGTSGLFGGVALSGYISSTTQELSNCEIAEVLIYNVVLTDIDRQAIENYLMSKWGLI